MCRTGLILALFGLLLIGAGCSSRCDTQPRSHGPARQDDGRMVEHDRDLGSGADSERLGPAK